MTIAVPYDWLRHVPHSFIENEDLPFFGHPPAFPWEQLSEIFGKIFQLSSVNIVPAAWEFRSANELYAGLGSKPMPLYIDLSPLEGNLCFVMAEEDVERLMKLFLLGPTEAIPMIDTDYLQGFYQFLALEVFNIFTKLDYAKGVVPHLLDKMTLPMDSCICQDITLGVNGSSFIGRLIVSDLFRKSWKERFAERTLNAPLTTELSSKIQVIVHFEAGRVALTRKEWDDIAPGDFLLLDQCSLEGDGEKGRVLLTLNNRTLHRAKVKDGAIKILETPQFHEIETQIAPKQKQEAQLPDTFDEEFTDFDEDFSEIEGHTTISEDLASPEAAGATPSEASKMAQVPTKTTAASQPSAGGISALKTTSPLGLNEIPLTVVIEIGRMQISVQKLLDLEPGNLLELDIHPENGVDLVVNGNVIGKGELLKIGDSLGVRILDKA
jgi:flagellar motor switch protein FliN